jgi:hypothetical protein
MKIHMKIRMKPVWGDARPRKTSWPGMPFECESHPPQRQLAAHFECTQDRPHA